MEQCTEFQFALCWPSLNMFVKRPTGTGEQSKYIFTLCWPRLQMFVEAPQAQVSRVLRSIFSQTIFHRTSKKTRSKEGLERL